MLTHTHMHTNMHTTHAHTHTNWILMIIAKEFLLSVFCVHLSRYVRNESYITNLLLKPSAHSNIIIEEAFSGFLHPVCMFEIKERRVAVDYLDQQD